MSENASIVQTSFNLFRSYNTSHSESKEPVQLYSSDSSTVSIHLFVGWLVGWLVNRLVGPLVFWQCIHFLTRSIFIDACIRLQFSRKIASIPIYPPTALSTANSASSAFTMAQLTYHSHLVLPPPPPPLPLLPPLHRGLKLYEIDAFSLKT